MPTSCACCCRVGRSLGGAGHVGSSWAGTTTADTASGATTVSDSAAIGGWHVLLSHCSSALFCGWCIFAALLPDLKPMAASTLHGVPLHDAQRSSLRGYASVPVASPRGSDRNLAAVDDSPPPFGSIHNVRDHLPKRSVSFLCTLPQSLRLHCCCWYYDMLAGIRAAVAWQQCPPKRQPRRRREAPACRASGSWPDTRAAGVTLTQLLRLAASIAQWARTHAMTDSNGLSAWLCVRMHRWMGWVAGWLGASAGGDGTASLRASIVWALKVDCPVSSTRAQPGGVDTHA